MQAFVILRKKTLPEENGEKRRTGGRKSTGTGK